MGGSTRTITIPHLGRIEGHGGIYVEVAGDVVREVNLDIFEGSRYYEVLLKGKHFLEVQGIITRVCAICSASHTTAALIALENALGIAQSDRVQSLRGLLVIGSTIESHALHAFALAMPDFLGFDSVIAMAAKYPDEVRFALALKQLGNRIQNLIGGRAIHPVNTLVGGFGKLPGHDDLRQIRTKLEEAIDPLMRFVELVTTIEIPRYAAQETVYVALRPHEQGYRFRGTVLCTSRGEEFPLNSYREVVREFTVEHSHAKHAVLASGGTYVVGSLARLKLWGHLLRGRAREVFELLLPSGAEDNILYNNWAQLVELVHCLERGIEVCDRLAALEHADNEMVDYEVRAGRGIGAIEAPRGTLIHDYEIDDEGRVTSANVITPTAQNLANTERDLRRAAENLLGERPSPTEREVELGLEMVVRAYDPCISCSVHVTRVPEDE